MKVPSRILWVAGEQQVENEQQNHWPALAASDLANTLAGDADEALYHLQAGCFDVIVLQLLSGDTACLERLRATVGASPIFVHAPHATLADAVRWTKLGASQIFQNEVDLSEAVLSEARRREHMGSSAAPNASAPPWRRMLIGNTAKMNEIAEVIRLIAPRRCTALITGETGTGKEVVARSIHAAGNRAHLDMVSVNCSALPENLLEAELFGHVRGAFTGAVGNRLGRFEQAHRSTIFLDEIGDLPMALQAKLLRVLQEREFQRLGSSETVRVDIRVIAATNVSLHDKIRAGAFREDLFYRLNVVPIHVPPLRDRCADIPELVYYFVQKICAHEGIPIKHLSDEALTRIRQHDWPGNVRQLENSVEMAVALSGDRTLLYPSDFGLPSKTHRSFKQNPFVAVPDHGLDFEQTVGSFELNILQQALRKTRGNKKLAAEMLGLKRTTLAAKWKSLTGTMPGSLLSQ